MTQVSSSDASQSTSTGPNYGTSPFANGGAGASAPTSAAAGRSNFRTSVINLDRPGNPAVFSESVRADAAMIIARYPVGQARSALLPLLHLVQSEQGYVSPDGIAFCADLLDITKAQVVAVATFYTMYKRHPTGEYLVSVCTNTLCGLLGGDEIFDALKTQLGIANNQTTPDGRITLEHAECIAACDYAPVVTVNYEFYDNQTPGTARDLVSRLQSGERPDPTRGAPLCSFKQIERQIAGIYDEVSLALDSTSTGVPTEAGVRLAIERNHTAPSYAVDSEEPTPADTPAPSATPVAEARADAQPGAPLAQPAPVEATPAAASDQPAIRKRTRGRTDKRGRGAPADPSGSTPDSGSGEPQAPNDNKAQPGSAYGPSDHDAPLQTAESDPANPTHPGTEKG